MASRDTRGERSPVAGSPGPPGARRRRGRSPAVTAAGPGRRRRPVSAHSERLQPAAPEVTALPRRNPWSPRRPAEPAAARRRPGPAGRAGAPAGPRRPPGPPPSRPAAGPRPAA